MIFDQNGDHSLDIIMGLLGSSMSYGLSFYVDKLPRKDKKE